MKYEMGIFSFHDFKNGSAADIRSRAPAYKHNGPPDVQYQKVNVSRVCVSYATILFNNPVCPVFRHKKDMTCYYNKDKLTRST